MKKNIACLLAGLFFLTLGSTQVKAGVTTSTTSVPIESTQANVLLNRLNEINTMDKSEMKSSEKKHLKKEVRTINKELKQMNGGGIYLSVGAIIIIILLLILIL
jgi:hypothetical protein